MSLSQFAPFNSKLAVDQSACTIERVGARDSNDTLVLVATRPTRLLTNLLSQKLLGIKNYFESKRIKKIF